jgi:uncharacterized membrane protein
MVSFNFLNSIFFALLLAVSCGGQHAYYSASEGPVVVGSQLTANFASIKSNIFQSKCLPCHVKGEEAEDVLLDDLSVVLTSSRKVVVVGKPEESKLITAIKRTDSKQMPPSDSGIDRLTQQEISLIEEWIQKGAPP